MALVSYPIPNLSQGISQQPDAQRDPSQGEIQVNGTSSIMEGLRKRDASEVLAEVSTSSFGDCFIHSILRDNVEEYLAVITDSIIKVYDLAGNVRTVSPATNAYNYLSTVSDAKQDIRAVTIADYTFISNTKKIPAMKTATAPATARPSTHEAMVWVRAASYGNEYKLTVNSVSATVTTAVAPVISGTDGSGNPTVTENRISSADIAENLKTALASAGLSGVTITRSGSVLWLQSASAITLAANDARANADITAILSKVQTFTELPTIAPNGYQIEIEGDPGNNFDGYYVEFVPKSGTFGEGLWVETVSPGVEYEIDKDTMPHLLVRKPDNTFYFGPANGSTFTGTTNGVAWEIKIPTWGERAAGDYGTAPSPSFIGNAINDIFIYKNRLGFLADENVILSRVREFFNFWPETVTTILDSDPIDVVASNNKVSVLRYAVPYQDELILFSSQYQFRFNAAETVLTPATAQITVLTQFETDVAVRPQQSGGGIVFAQSNGDWAQFREFSVRGAGTALTADAADLTGYVSAYVPSGLFKLTVNDTSNAIFGISSKTGHKNRIYVYKYFVRNTGQGVERAQSSWSHWELSGADEILQILCVRETLYLLVRYGTKVYLEKIPVMDRLSEPVAGSPYPFLLDRRVSTTTATPAGVRVSAGSYDATTKKTTWTLPYTITSRTEAWSGFDTSANGGVFLGFATSGNTIIGNGNWSGSPVWFGESYNFRYRFTRFKLYKEIGGGKAAANVERTQVRNAKLRYHETHYFEIHVFPEGRDVGKYKFDGTILGSRNSLIGTALPSGWDSDDERFYEGVFTFPIMSRGERCMVEIHNDTPHPCKFSTCEWVALITSKARSLR
tara:strand:+ start:11900 stop:14446 length:2547 start_codon:yes stop_codon:yes gene_type:complete